MIISEFIFIIDYFNNKNSKLVFSVAVIGSYLFTFHIRVLKRHYIPSLLYFYKKCFGRFPDHSAVTECTSNLFDFCDFQQLCLQTVQRMNYVSIYGHCDGTAESSLSLSFTSLLPSSYCNNSVLYCFFFVLELNLVSFEYFDTNLPNC